MKEKTAFRLALIVILAWGVGVVFLPFFWIIVTSITPMEQLHQTAFWIIPSSVTVSSPDPETNPLYLDWLSGKNNFWKFYGNSIILSVATALITIPLSLTAGYALARFGFKGNRAVTIFLIFMYMLPPTILAAPYLILSRSLGLFDTITVLVLVNLVRTVPFAVWTSRIIFEGIPVAIEEAAMVDGYSRLGAVRRVLIPLSKPAIFVVGIWSFIIAWSDFLFAVSLTANQATPITPVIYQITFQYGVTLNTIMSLAILNSIPLLLLFVLFQKFIVKGMIAGWGKF